MRFTPATEEAHNIILHFASTSVYNLFMEVIKVRAPCKFRVLN